MRAAAQAMTVLDAYAASVRSITQRSRSAASIGPQVAEALALVLAEPNLLTAEQKLPSPSSYRQHLLHRDPDRRFSIVSLVWQPGQGTTIHDHISWCVVGVYQGVEEETSYQLAPDGTHLVAGDTMLNPAGSTSVIVPPGDIHRVSNSSAEKVISIHVYGADIALLGSSIRRRYDLPVLPAHAARIDSAALPAHAAQADSEARIDG